MTLNTVHKTAVRAVLIIGSLLFYCQLFAQLNRFNENWTFGDYAGISFSGSNTVPLLGSAMASPEGVATISENGSGQIVFYSNGEKVWGYNHLLINSGDQLMGSANSTMSASFVPYPQSSRFIYLFTTDAEGGSNGIRYSLLDKDFGTNGRVVPGVKNIPLASPVAEKISVFRHCNRQSYWVVAHEWGSDRFFSWLVTDTGLISIPVETSVGPVYSGIKENTIGYMKASPMDDFLALAVTGSNRVDFFHFNNATGIPSFSFSLDSVYQPYGVEFSSDESMLYVGCLTGEIYQFDLQAPNVQASKTLIASSGKLTGALQMGPDYRIYIARDLDQYLGYIGMPGSPGACCNYVEDGLYLSGRLSEAGLPPYIPELRINSLTSYSICLGDSVVYYPTFLQMADSFLFTFDDPLSGFPDTTSQIPARHLFTKVGYHPVELIYYMCGSEYRLKAEVCVQSTPGVYLGEDTAICGNSVWPVYAILNSVYCPTLQNSFHWNTGQTTQGITISPPGDFAVTVTNLCGSGSDSIHIFALPYPSVTLGPDLQLCTGEAAALLPFPSSDSLVWSDGSEDPVKFVNTPGIYAVTVVNEFNCSSSDDITVQFIDPPALQWVPEDTTICIGIPMELDAGSGFTSYLWQDGSSGVTFVVSDSGWYSVHIENQCGEAFDSMHVNLDDCSLKLFVPNAFTPDGDGLNDVFKASIRYVEELSMCIFTRWGERIFCTADFQDGWDGKYRDEPAPEGVYVWKITYRDTTGDYHTLSGTVFLFRK
jgi:gliding motility-associated-like protein